MTKMIVAIVNDEDTNPISEGLQHIGLYVSRIASTGGFLRQGRNTLMVGVDDNKVNDAINVISENCAPRIEPISKRATLFILNVEHFEQI